MTCRTLLAQWIRSERVRRGWSREDVEELSGVSVSTVRRIEAGSEAVAFGLVRAVIETLGGWLEVRCGHAK